jgi:predicted acetyltransferase
MKKLVLPTKKYLNSAREAMKERWTFGEISKQDLRDELALMDDAETYINNILAKRKITGKQSGQIPFTRYWLIDGEEYIGTLGLRHKVTKQTKDYEGHIGYHIRPSKRSVGYGTEILRLGLRKAKSMGLNSLYINCAKDNAASIKIIEKNGGIPRKKKLAESKSDSVHYKVKLV